jgi:hypothetical protein
MKKYVKVHNDLTVPEGSSHYIEPKDPDFVQPFISEKEKSKAKEYNRVYDQLRGAIHTEDFSLENVAQYLAHNKLLK